MLDYAPVTVSGRGTNAEFIIDDSMSFADTSKALRGYLIEHRGLWSGGEIILTVGARFFPGSNCTSSRKSSKMSQDYGWSDFLRAGHHCGIPWKPGRPISEFAAAQHRLAFHAGQCTRFREHHIQIRQGGSRAARWPSRISIRTRKKAVNPPSKAQAKRTRAKTKQSNHSKRNLEAALLVKSTCRSEKSLTTTATWWCWATSTRAPRCWLKETS